MSAPKPVRPLSINLAPMPSYSNFFPFWDAAKKCGGFYTRKSSDGTFTDTGYYTSAALDADGYPASVPQTLGGGSQLFSNRCCPVSYAGVWVLLWDGTGTVQLDNRPGDMTLTSTAANRLTYTAATAPADGGSPLVITITSSSASNRVNNIRLLIPGGEAVYKTSPLNTDWTTRFGGVGVLRFMDWFATNGSSIVNWSQRTTEFALQQGDSDGTNGKGASYELACDMCNQMQCDLWLNIPPTTSDTYVTNLATLVKGRLNTARSVIIELGNESWNGTGGAGYMQAQGMAAGFSGASYEQTWKWQTRRSAQVFKLFYLAFGNSSARLLNTVGSQAYNLGVTSNFLSYFADPTINPLYNDVGAQLDSVAIAPYCGANFYNTFTGTEGATAVFTALWTSMSASVGNDGVVASVAGQKGLVGSKRLVAYEGGQHLASYGDRTKGNLVNSTLLDARMSELYRTYFRKWFEITGNDIFCHFNDVGYSDSQQFYWPMIGATNSATGSYPRMLGFNDHKNAFLSGTLFTTASLDGSGGGIIGTPNTGSVVTPPTGTPSGSAGVTGSVIVTSSFGPLYTSASFGLVFAGNGPSTTQVPFNNLWLQAEDWKTVNINSGTFGNQQSLFTFNTDTDMPTEVPRTSAGEPIGVAAGFGLQIYPGSYNLKYDGDGQIVLPLSNVTVTTNVPNNIVFSVAAPSTGSQMTLQINRSNVSNPVRNIRILKPGVTDAQNTAQIFNSDFISASLGSGVVRFSEWQDAYGSTIVSTADLAVSGGIQGGASGVSLPLCCQAANVLGATPWFVVPSHLNDTAVLEMARQIKLWLRLDVNVIIEYSSDGSDPNNPQTTYFTAQGTAMGLNAIGNFQNNDYYTGLKFYSRRAAQVFKIFQDYFGYSRTIPVLAGTPGDIATNAELMAEFNNPAINPLSTTLNAKAKAFCTAPFVGTAIIDNYAGTETLTNVFSDLYTELSGSWKTNTQSAKNLANSFGLRYFGSAGGQNLAGTSPATIANATLQNLVDNAQRDDRMRVFYQDYLSAWQTINADYLALYSSTRSAFGAGSYGLMEIQTASSTPKQNAFINSLTNFFIGTSNNSGSLGGGLTPSGSTGTPIGSSGSAPASGTIIYVTQSVYIDRPVYVTASCDCYGSDCSSYFASDIINWAKQDCDLQNSRKPTDAEALRWVNSAVAELHSIIADGASSMDNLTIKLPMTASVAFPSCSLPKNFMKLRMFETVETDGTTTALSPCSLGDREYLQIGGGDTPYYFKKKGALELVPAQAAAGSYNLWYIPTAHTMDTTGSCLDSVYDNNDFRDFIVKSTALTICMTQGNMESLAQLFKLKVDTLRAKIVKDCTKIDASGRVKVRVRRSDIEDNYDMEIPMTGPRRP